MSDVARRLAAQYLSGGTLPGLPTGHLIDGRELPSLGGETQELFDPGRAQPYHRVAAGQAADAERAVAAARTAFRTWRKSAPAERGAILARAAALVRERRDAIAVALALEVGKTLAEALGEVGGVAKTFDYYAGAADKIQGETIPLGPEQLAFTLLEPVGVVAQIVPWNYPLSTLARGLAPALAAGCCVVVKPAETTPTSTLMVAKLLLEAGLPPGVCNVLLGTGPAAGQPLVAHPDIAHVNFVGSPATGTAVMQTAATHFASITLELGGKSPIVALADCDVAAAASGTVGAIFENAGQICSAGSRLVVERRIHRPLVEAIVERAGKLRVGHGLRDNDMGAINSERQLKRVLGYLDGARARGRAIVIGGTRVYDDNAGWFVAPTVIDALPADDACVQEEIFGPVLSVQVAEDAAHALALANGTRYGLMAGIYTADIGRALKLARELESGQVTINDYWGGGTGVPFGGVGHSGFGREKGLVGLAAFCRVKAVVAKVPA